ncbi:FAD-dependent oxidoreductase [Blastopirellula marina]|uniref:Protein-xanthan lyase n=1 Tax=Blastopirellula marina TaxID=124 RepID=A0A2S8F7F2_9BACT|nr:FAD-dependent oxidoreductase [Blastopirellula marina]PQO27864.1 protein-xanthan lyase [Blastopirellula marina]PTL41599.1 FAD-dependent oxidoreductase [Blastopirellula marina]
MRTALVSLIAIFTLASALPAQTKQIETEVCVYGATPAGILAAIAVKRGGHQVVIVEPSRWVGGMLGAGLKPMQDCPNHNATGGLTKDLLLSLGQPAKGQRLATRDLSPLEIRQDFLDLLAQHEIPVYFDHRYRTGEKVGATDVSSLGLSPTKQPQINQLAFDYAPFDELGCPVDSPVQERALQVAAKIYIDASYEGSLMHGSIPFRSGRESTAEFGEALAGVRPPVLLTPIDPYRIPGDPSSGLLPLLEEDHGKPIGAADHYTQAYNYRYYTTNDPENRLPIDPPEAYSAQQYELVGRYIEYLTTQHTDQNGLRKALVGICPGWMNSGEWNYQRNSLITMAPVGISWKYIPSGSPAVWKEHQNYLRGLFHFMRTDARVPEWYRQEIAELGLDKRFHPATAGWPHQLYIRVAKRLKGRYTITAHDVYNRTKIDDPIGLAQYGIDTYPARRIVVAKDGQTYLANEGNMFIGGNKGPTNVPYPIPYRAITPKSEDCTNLLVPVCFSASHLGYASARMEPVFMICGESAGIAAVQALEENVPVQNIDMDRYQKTLRAAGQKLTWDPAVDRSSSSSSNKLDFAKLQAECDTNKDGVVSQQEWNAGKSGWEFLFAFIDQDQDGKMTPAEYDRFQKYKAEHPNWRKELSN